MEQFVVFAQIGNSCIPRRGQPYVEAAITETWEYNAVKILIDRQYFDTLKISIVSQLCSGPISLSVTLIDIVVLIVMMDGHSNGSKYKETHCKVNWDADLYDRWSKYEATHCKGDQVEANTGGDHSPRLHP